MTKIQSAQAGKSSTQKKVYFDLHVTGFGYLNRVRDVSPDKGDPYLSCDIVALSGESTKPSKVKFFVNVVGAEAQHLVRRCEPAVTAEKKVLIGFRLGDLSPDIYSKTKGPDAGKPAVSLMARLLFVSWIKVNGKLVYKAEPKHTETSPQEEEVPTPSPAQPAQPPVAAPASEPDGRDDDDADEVVTQTPVESSALVAEPF